MTDEQDARIEIPVTNVVLAGDLVVPGNARGVVVFAHGSGSSRLSPRNRSVAAFLHERGLGTLLFDLLTHEEERAEAVTRHLRFDIGLLAGRLVEVTQWLSAHLGPARALAYFGASTGAAAALVAAAELPDEIRAVVSRGGRPDLAGAALERVHAPTLLVVGGRDIQVLELNEAALAQLPCEKQLVVVPGATHLFEEPGTLEQVAQHAAQWLGRHFADE